ncbi:hypothetical protein HD554DRAFT_1993024, partial [Boletus coccyginus]
NFMLQVLNDGRQISRVFNTVETHSTLVMLLSQCDTPWLHHILHTLLKTGRSISAILYTITNGYNPHSYNQVKFDLALLVYCVGG